MTSSEVHGTAGLGGRLRIVRLLALVVLASWGLHFLLVSALLLAQDWQAHVDQLPVRVIGAVTGIIVSALIIAVHLATGSRPLWQRVSLTVAIACGGATLDSALAPMLVAAICGPELATPADMIVVGALQRMWFYTFLSSTILLFTYAASLRERDQRLAALAANVHAAQIKALRYQLNPHFLFNTLNAISALVHRKQHGAAEVMIENLSDFLRAGLALDPQEDVALGRELQMTALYFEIERLRFPGRLALVTDVPDELSGARLPSLSTLPLIEQAVKVAVSDSGHRVTVLVSARHRSDMLHVQVATRGTPGAAGWRRRSGAMEGLTERLRGRFGTNFELLETRDAAGETELKLIVPYRPGTSDRQRALESLV